MTRRSWWVLGVALSGLAQSPAAGTAQQQPSIPEEMGRLVFMLGDWTVEGAFRTPDHVGADRTLWYVTGDDGVVRFDGQAWIAYPPGASVTGDSVRALITSRADPYRFEAQRAVRQVQDGFALLLDDGETAGTTLVYFDTEESAWVAQALHAPTNATTRAAARRTEGLPVFEGTGRDRRGERRFRRRYELESPDHYRIRTDVSFDDGVTWIVDQIVQDVRRAQPGHGSDTSVALDYLGTLYRFDFEGLGALMGEHVRFADPTGVALGGALIQAEGREAVLDAFREGAEGTRNPGFTMKSAFESGGYVILTLTYHTELEGGRWNLEQAWLPVDVAATTVIRIEDGLVVEHTDYVDYASLLGLIEDARAVNERRGMP